MLFYVVSKNIKNIYLSKKEFFNFSFSKRNVGGESNPFSHQVIICIAENFCAPVKTLQRLELLRRLNYFSENNVFFTSVEDFEEYYKKFSTETRCKLDREASKIRVQDNFASIRKMVSPMGVGNLPTDAPMRPLPNDTKIRENLSKYSHDSYLFAVQQQRHNAPSITSIVTSSTLNYEVPDNFEHQTEPGSNSKKIEISSSSDDLHQVEEKKKSFSEKDTKYSDKAEEGAERRHKEIMQWQITGVCVGVICAIGAFKDELKQLVVYSYESNRSRPVADHIDYEKKIRNIENPYVPYVSKSDRDVD
jgi:hypothetical protein